MNPQVDDVTVKEIEEFQEEEQVSIRLINVIFLPFHPAVRLLTLCAAIAKSLLGPFAGTYSEIMCATQSEISPFLYYPLRFYESFSDAIIGIDFFLHIVHRQVTEEASKREYAPKSLIALFLDAISIIPFFSFIQPQACPPTRLWPNIMMLTEIFCFYRIIEYFDLKDTHSIANLLIGYTIILLFLVNLVACVFVLMTYHGLCSACDKGIYDWRLYFINDNKLMNEGYNLYDFAMQIVAKNLFFIDLISFRPVTYFEFAFFSVLMLMGFLLITFIVGPKVFTEMMLRARKSILFHTRANRIIKEANKRNPSSDVNLSLEKYFSVIWKKQEGVTVPPKILDDIPRYMKLLMKEDIAWAVFHHSPTLRRTSSPYKRWLYDQMILEYKMPGDRLFSGRHCYTRLYYLKAGILQLLSADDGATPVLSVTGGSLFGDVSFYLPPLQRQTLMRCLTDTEIIAIPRAKLLTSLHKFPEDRCMILQSTTERIRHAKILNSCKTGIRGLDRTEDEGLAWLKTRWWILWRAIQHWKKSSKKDTQKCRLPADKSSYHCSKYIGQLVLCTRDQLQLNAIFANVKFPWIISENSSFTVIWHKIMKCIVLMVLLIFPPNVAREHKPDWFNLFSNIVDIIYIADFLFFIITKTEKQRNDVDFKEVVVAKFKSTRFVLDVLSTAWLGQLFTMMGQDTLASVAPLTRLLKMHVFFNTKLDSWNRNSDPFSSAIANYFLVWFITLYLAAYLFFILIPLLDRGHISNMQFIFGPSFCDDDKKCISSTWLFYYYILGYYLSDIPPQNTFETWMHMTNYSIIYFVTYYGEYRILSLFFLKYRDISKYNVLVTNLKWFYRKYELHPDAMKRVERYFLCQWRSNYGLSIMYPHATAGESESTRWAHHGRAAERVIGASRLFADSHPSLVKDLAEKSRFSLVPQGFTLILFGVQCNNITWITDGELKCEYKNADDNIVSFYTKPTDILTVSPLFPGLASFKTFVTATDCEILYITKKDFFKVMKQHSEEWTRLDACIKELSPIFDEIFSQFLKQHQMYQKKLRERIFHDRKSVFAVTVKPKIIEEEIPPTSIPFGTFISSPEAPFVRFWITTRMFVALLAIINVNIKRFVMHYSFFYDNTMFLIQSLCDFIGLADIVLNLFLPYLDDRGLIVSDYTMCMKHYLTRGFILDVIGTFPWQYLALLSGGHIAYGLANEYEIYTKYAHLYIINGYLNYIVDKPCSYRNHILFMKWQIIFFLVMLGAGNFFFYRCYVFQYDEVLDFVSTTERRMEKTCWRPFFKSHVDHRSFWYKFRIVESVEMAQDFMLGIYRSVGYAYTSDTAITWVTGLSLHFVFWFVALYSETIIILNEQTNTAYQHAVQELIHFLKEERVEKPIIERCIAHYNYIWLRTKGLDAEKLYKDIGTGNTLSQDINFYMFKSVYQGLNSIFKGGEILERKLSGVVTTRTFLPNEIIMREMDLVPFVYIVCCGEVTISRRGRKLTTVAMGGLVGQLSGALPRPARVTAHTDDYTDVLEISIEDFQDIFGQEYQELLAKYPYDFIKKKKEVNAIPSLHLQYIIRGMRILKFPFIMKKPVDIRNCVWYERFLYLAWIFFPSASIFVFAFLLLYENRPILFHILITMVNIIDALYLVYYITELFTMELVIVNNNIECRYFKWRLLCQWSFILNTLSFIVPKLGYIFLISNNLILILLDMPKLFRTHLYIYFYKHFCNNFQNKFSPIMLKLLILLNILHICACMWLFISCNEFSARMAMNSQREILQYAPEYINKSIDWNEWTLGQFAAGCLRISKEFPTPNGVYTVTAISKHWYGDYLMAYWNTVTVLTKTEFPVFRKYGHARIYRMFMSYFIRWSRFWIVAAGITLFFTNFNELYAFERRIDNLKTYFKCNRLSNALLEALDTYAKQLWKRQKGSSIPKFALQAPLCLKQDIFSSLYMHHLRTPMLFQVFPEYFLRQLAVRLTRKVVFPGNYIVKEGDIHPTLYFIHEGEVEKWCTDAKGESKMSCVLTMNGYFGLVPALFPNAHFQFAYYSRTVVDLICLNFVDWQDLLEAYPDVKTNLYQSAQKYKHEKLGKSKLDAQN